jgi:hypothetical protein
MSDNIEYILPFSWKKGQSGNPNGRPRKFVCQLKDMGYNKQDINQTIENMMAMTLNELADIFKDEHATILERTIANAMRKSLEKGTLYSLETLISRVHGVPSQTINQLITEKPIFNGIDINVTTNDSPSENI